MDGPRDEDLAVRLDRDCRRPVLVCSKVRRDAAVRAESCIQAAVHVVADNCEIYAGVAS